SVPIDTVTLGQPGVQSSEIKRILTPVVDPLPPGSQNAFDLTRLHPWLPQSHRIDGHRIGDDKVHRVVVDGERGIRANQEVVPYQGELFKRVAGDGRRPCRVQGGGSLLVHDTWNLPVATEVRGRDRATFSHEAP